MTAGNGSAEAYVLLLLGYCSAMPPKLMTMFADVYKFDRSAVGRLRRAGYLIDKAFCTEDRRTAHSLRLSQAGMRKLAEIDPVNAQLIEQHPLVPLQGRSVWLRTKRMHRGAACLYSAVRLGAMFRPVPEKDEAIGKRLVYYTPYEFTRRYEQDGKAARVNGIFISAQKQYFPVYYLGNRNMAWNPEVETGFRYRFEDSELGWGLTYGCDILIADDWMLAVNLVKQVMNSRSGLIRITDTTRFRMTTLDDCGLQMLRLTLDESRLWALGRFLESRTGCPFSTAPDFVFDLGQIERFRPAANASDRYFRPESGSFFSFQIPAMQAIAGEGIELRSVPAELLTEFFGKHAEQTAAPDLS